MSLFGNTLMVGGAVIAAAGTIDGPLNAAGLPPGMAMGIGGAAIGIGAAIEIASWAL